MRTSTGDPRSGERAYGVQTPSTESSTSSPGARRHSRWSLALPLPRRSSNATGWDDGRLRSHGDDSCTRKIHWRACSHRGLNRSRDEGMLPDRSDYEICGELKNDERTAKFPVAMLTAKSSDADKTG